MRKRAGFTLLEVVLASGIAALLLGALYVAVDVQLRLSQAGREVVEQSALVRALSQRLTADLSATLGLGAARNYAAAAAAAEAALAAADSATQPEGETTDPAAMSQDSAAVAMPLPMFAVGLVGDPYQVTFYVSRVPGSRSPAGTDAPSVAGDVRKVTLWQSDGGLARREQALVTGEEALSGVLPSGADAEAFLLAPEVREVEFSYFDGAAWQVSWDGAQLNTDGVTPLGPPRAVAVRMGVVPPGAGPDAALKYTRHVVALPAATGTPAASATTGVVP